MTFLELVQRVWREVGYQGVGPADVTPTALQERRVVDWVQQAHADIQSKWADWKFLWVEGTVTTVDGTEDYAGPANLAVWEEDTVRIGDVELEFIPFADYRRDRPVYTTTGRPHSFTILPNNSVRLMPTPNAEYTIDFDYYRKPKVLSGNADTPLIPVDYHDTIVWLAKVLWAQFDEAAEQGQAAGGLFEAAMKRLQNDQLPSRDNHNRRQSGVDIMVVPQ